MAARRAMARGLSWGDIRLVSLGSPDKTRPAVVLTRSSAIPYMSAVTVAPITRTIRHLPTEVLIGVEEGLKQASAINFDHVQTISKERLGRYLGSVSPLRKREIAEAVQFALELE